LLTFPISSQWICAAPPALAVPDEPQALETVANKIDEQGGKLADVLAAGVADKSFTPSLQPDKAATASWATIDGILALRWRSDSKVVEPQQVRDIAEFAVATILNGIRPR
jgi:hypothetical protein